MQIKFNNICIKTEEKGENWWVELPAMPYGGSYEMEICLDEKTITLHDI